jgi:hypothetical protein
VRVAFIPGSVPGVAAPPSDASAARRMTGTFRRSCEARSITRLLHFLHSLHVKIVSVGAPKYHVR